MEGAEWVYKIFEDKYNPIMQEAFKAVKNSWLTATERKYPQECLPDLEEDKKMLSFLKD